jgi:aldose 1-epimerase
MTFQITWKRCPNAFGLDDQVAVLGDANNTLEVWPALGFNAHRWQVAGHELLYRNPQFFTDMRPTRSGFPILFPFPNRIRAGRFEWNRRSYQLPLNDPAARNAIHGFAAYRSWRIIDQGSDVACAWLTGEFHGARDAAETLELWPADYRLRVTYRLFDRVLRVEADADNPSTKSLPFGLGYHPYFLLSRFGGEEAIVSLAAEKLWELTENLPTGVILDMGDDRKLRGDRNLLGVQLDDVLTDLRPIAFDQEDQLGLVGVVQHPAAERMLTLWVGKDFRELVAFTPPHREALCLEPYTCTTDAVNLAQRGVDAGWRVLQPGEHWQSVVEVHLAT